MVLTLLAIIGVWCVIWAALLPIFPGHSSLEKTEGRSYPQRILDELSVRYVCFLDAYYRQRSRGIHIHRQRFPSPKPWGAFEALEEELGPRP
jgi:hypothetical protein